MTQHDTLDPLAAALGYIARGWHVFPLQGKRPATPHGWKDASTDPRQVAAWWAGTDANVGIATGDSGLIVVDLDTPDAVAWWDERDQTPTATVATGKGEHRYYRGVGRSTAGTLAPGVDTRGLGGYVVAPPSLHPRGSRYAWKDPAQGLAEAPAWLLQALRVRPKRQRYDWGRVLPAGVLAVVVAQVRGAPPGYRNETLNRAAWLCRGNVPHEWAVPALLEAALQRGLGWDESGRTIASGLGIPLGDVLAYVERTAL